MNLHLVTRALIARVPRVHTNNRNIPCIHNRKTLYDSHKNMLMKACSHAGESDSGRCMEHGRGMVGLAATGVSAMAVCCVNCHSISVFQLHRPLCEIVCYASRAAANSRPIAHRSRRKEKWNARQWYERSRRLYTRGLP